MRVLILSTDPPRLLATALAELGHDVAIVTEDAGDAPALPVAVRPVAEYPPMVPDDDLLSRTLQLNVGMVEEASLLAMRAPIDLIHAHDWRVAYAAVTLHRTFDAPLVASLSSTQLRRRRGRLRDRMDELVHQMEWWLVAGSARVIVRSRVAEREVRENFNAPPEKVRVVPSPATASSSVRAARRVAAVYDEAVSAGAQRLHRLDERQPLRDLFERDPILGAVRA